MAQCQLIDAEVLAPRHIRENKTHIKKLLLNKSGFEKMLDFQVSHCCFLTSVEHLAWHLSSCYRQTMPCLTTSVFIAICMTLSCCTLLLCRKVPSVRQLSICRQECCNVSGCGCVHRTSSECQHWTESEHSHTHCFTMRIGSSDIKIMHTGQRDDSGEV